MNNSNKYEYEITPEGLEQAISLELLGGTSNPPMEDLKQGLKGVLTPSTDAKFSDKGGESTSGTNTPLSENRLSGNCIEQVKSDSDLTSDNGVSAPAGDNDDKTMTPAKEIMKAKNFARQELAKKKKGKISDISIDEIKIEKNMLESWLTQNDDEYLAHFFGSKTYHMWKDQGGLTFPSHASGRLGYYIAAVKGLRKVGYSWEQLVITDGQGDWICFREDLLESYISGFFAGAGLISHMYSIENSRSIVDRGRKELENLPWSENLTFSDELHQWVHQNIVINNIDDASYATSSKELLNAYIVNTGDTSMTNISFGRRFSIALQEIRKDEFNRGRIRKTNNIRKTAMCGTVEKCTGWIGIKILLSDKDKLLVKEKLGCLSNFEIKQLNGMRNVVKQVKSSSLRDRAKQIRSHSLLGNKP